VRFGHPRNGCLSYGLGCLVSAWDRATTCSVSVVAWRLLSMRWNRSSGVMAARVSWGVPCPCGFRIAHQAMLAPAALCVQVVFEAAQAGGRWRKSGAVGNVFGARS
jgi:hypothetical protein